MNTTRTRTKIAAAAVGAAIASVAAPVLLLFSAGSAQADNPTCNLPQVHWPAACTDHIANPQPPSVQLAPGLSREWFRPDPVFRR
jgi:hypothetical protein